MNSRPIAFFLSELHGGGAQRVIVNLANDFAQRGLSVDLVLAKAEGAYLSKVAPKVRIVNLQASKLIYSLFPLVEYLHKAEPKWLISGLSGANLLAIAAKFLTKSNCKCMITIHNNLVKTANNQVYQRRKLLPYLQRLFYSSSDVIVAVSQGVADSLTEVTGIAPAKIQVIYNPIVTPQIEQMASEVPEQDFFDDGLPVILGVGRLNQQKDFANLIRAFAIAKKGQPARLIILGEGEERSQLEALVTELDLADSVCLPGFVNNPYVYMARASVLVLSSAWEGFGNVLVEAMACGTKVIATDCPSGPREILEGGKYGKLVPTEDPESLATAIANSLISLDNSEILRTRATDFSVRRISQQYLDLIGDR